MENSNDIFDRILADGPSQNTIFLVLKKMKEEKRFGRVITECLKALEFYPNDIRLRILLTEGYLEMGFINQAERELDRITPDIENLMSAYKMQADIYTRQKRHEEASKALNKYLTHLPDDREALDLLAKLKAVEERPFKEGLEITEETALPLEEEFGEEVKEEIITELPEIPEETVFAAEEEPSPQEPHEEVVLVEEREIEEESLPEITEEIVTTLEEEVEGVPETLIPVAEEEGDASTHLATPTLAEIYYKQGLIDDAISTYERVLLDNPQDEASIARLEELKGEVAEKTGIELTPEDTLRARTEKMITVLEGWLERIQESGHA
jgi:tetratricopeptide (TPR) repeat protein